MHATWADPLAVTSCIPGESWRGIWVTKALTWVLSKSNWVGGQDSVYTRPAPHPQNRTHAQAPFVADHSKRLFLLLEMAEEPSRLISCRLGWESARVSQLRSSC